MSDSEIYALAVLTVVMSPVVVGFLQANREGLASNQQWAALLTARLLDSLLSLVLVQIAIVSLLLTVAFGAFVLSQIRLWF